MKCPWLYEGVTMLTRGHTEPSGRVSGTGEVSSAQGQPVRPNGGVGRSLSLGQCSVHTSKSDSSVCHSFTESTFFRCLHHLFCNPVIGFGNTFPKGHPCLPSKRPAARFVKIARMHSNRPFHVLNVDLFARDVDYRLFDYNRMIL